MFDTSFIIDLTRSDEGAKKVASIVDAEGSVGAISVISIHEYFLGIHMRYFQERELLSAKLDAAERQLAAFMILPLTREIALRSAEIQASLGKRGQIVGINDLYIAATAIVHEASIVTRNVEEFKHVQGIAIEKY